MSDIISKFTERGAIMDILAPGEKVPTAYLDSLDEPVYLSASGTSFSAPFIAGAVEDVAPFVELRHQKLVREWTADMGTMAIDPPKVRDAINHLLLNAIKFTPDGGTITVRASRADGAANVSIIDTGSGIEEEELKHYGEAFFTGYDVTKHSSGTYEHGRRGLGLGASVVKKFVEMHGGRVEVISKVGEGTTATIMLPESESG